MGLCSFDMLTDDIQVGWPDNGFQAADVAVGQPGSGSAQPGAPSMEFAIVLGASLIIILVLWFIYRVFWGGNRKKPVRAPPVEEKPPAKDLPEKGQQVIGANKELESYAPGGEEPEQESRGIEKAAANESEADAAVEKALGEELAAEPKDEVAPAASKKEPKEKPKKARKPAKKKAAKKE
ncbi:MAG: hypothetical protein ABII71_05815 [Candidatus Micrarchaeota archaeon]